MTKEEYWVLFQDLRYSFVGISIGWLKQRIEHGQCIIKRDVGGTLLFILLYSDTAVELVWINPSTTLANRVHYGKLTKSTLDKKLYSVPLPSTFMKRHVDSNNMYDNR